MNIIRIGTLVSGPNAVSFLPQLSKHGFESYSITFWQSTGDIDLPQLAAQVKDILGDSGAVISALSIFGNPLTGHGNNADTLASWERLIDNAHLFGTDIVSGFTGRIVDRPLDESLPKYAEVFGELGKRAQDKGVRIAFENCTMEGNYTHGDWNIAINPSMWEKLFNAIPSDNIGLEWEPCHQMTQLINPIPQLKKWAPKVFHVHGKDCSIEWDVIREHGTASGKTYAWHRTPGFGDTNWVDVISILRKNDYQGTIDIEGYHDPVYRGELEMTGQVAGLNYLKRCRGGSFVPNPTE